jgi:hypothetical protein
MVRGDAGCDLYLFGTVYTTLGIRGRTRLANQARLLCGLWGAWAKEDSVAKA